jgi:novel protein kinase C epsilon type
MDVAFIVVCRLNVHKRCEKNVANNCGINTKDMAQVLSQLGISGDKLNPSTKKKKVIRLLIVN